jgi:hypothetical protein
VIDRNLLTDVYRTLTTKNRIYNSGGQIHIQTTGSGVEESAKWELQ